MKLTARILVILILLAAVTAMFSNRLVSRYTVRQVEKATGFTATIGRVNVGLLRPVIRINDLTLRNPPEFPHEEAFTIRELYVRYNRLSLLGRELRLNHLVLDMPRIVMVKPVKGKSNIELLAGMGKDSKRDRSAPETAPAPQPERKDPGEPKKKKEPRTLVIDEMTIRMGEMEVRQYFANRPDPSIISVPVNFDRTYHSVTNMETLAVQLSTELVIKSSVAYLGQLGALLDENSSDSREQREQAKEQLKNLKNLFK